MAKESKNCVFYDEYTQAGLPCGAVECSKKECATCGWNPDVAAKRLENLKDMARNHEIPSLQDARRSLQNLAKGVA